MSDRTADLDTLSPKKRKLLELLLQEKERQSKIRPIPRREGAGPAPLSFAQQRLWFLDQLEPGSSYNNILLALRLKGRLSVSSLEESLNAIVRRHDILRTTFEPSMGKAAQVIAPALVLPLPVVDLDGLGEGEEGERRLRRAAGEEARRPFDLSRGPLLRATLVRFGAEEHVFLLTMHHTVSDGWSLGVFFKELAAFYEAFSTGGHPRLSPLAIQYADFADWQRNRLQGEVLKEQLDYWRQRLAGMPAVLELPTDRPRPAVQTYRGATHSLWLPRELLASLTALSHQEKATLYMMLLAAFQTLIHRYTGQEDIAIGSPSANRDRTELEGLIGIFANTLVLRTDCGGDPSFRQLLARVREVSLGAYAHQELPFEKLVEELHPQRSLSHSPLFQVMFASQNTPQPVLRLGDLTLSVVPLETGMARNELTLFTAETEQGLWTAFEYNTDLFDRATIERMAGHFRILLEGIAADPSRRLSELPLLSAAERERVVVEWNGTGSEYRRDEGLARLFEAQAERTPDAVAVVHEDRHLTYAELNRRANRMAHYLRRQGIGPDDLVGICLERSPDMMVGLLGIVKAGGAYVPLDPDFPRERLRFMLEDSGAAVLVTQAALEEGLPEHRARVISLDREGKAIEGESDENPVYRTKAEDLAYVIYTSGSTGKPKGVQIPHGALTNFLQAMKREPGIGADDVLLAVTTLSFDIAGLELYLPLTVGGRVVIAGRDVASDGIRLARLLGESRATVMQATPASWKLLRAAGWKGDGRLRMLCGGEALPMELAKELLGAGGELWNMYGPTETTIWSTVARVTGGEERIHIGRPIANTRVYILDGHGQPAPVGVPGELHIGGDGLARGYLKRPELDEEKFVPDAFSGDPKSRLYRTGDLARWQADGTIECLGRIDNQVKVRGYRIELGEIEAVLREQAGVKDAVVAALEEQGGEKRLVGYVVAADGADPDVAGLRRLLKAKLPDYMIPASFVRLEAFPLTPNGKIDRRALPAPERSLRGGDELYAGPRTPVEEVLAGLWEEVLGRERIGIHDDFFELGGHSLLATQLIAQVQEAFQAEIFLRQLFESPTVAGLADSILKNGKDRAKVEGRARMLVKLADLSEDDIKKLLEEKNPAADKDRSS